MSGILLLSLWTAAFIALPAISGWFLAACSLAFVTANSLFSYLIPSAVIRFIALVRTVTRYFERLENHRTTLEAQQRLQLKIFQSVARLPYFKKQLSNNSSLLENSTSGLDRILNHLLLRILPFVALTLSLIIYVVFLALFSHIVAIEFLISSAVLLFIIPQFIFQKNRRLYESLQSHREANSQALIQSFSGRIEILKYNLAQKAIGQYERRLLQLEQTETKLEHNSLRLQLVAGLGCSYIAAFTLWSTSDCGIDAPVALGIFFGIMAQAELAEMLFSGKSEKNAVARRINDLDAVITQGEQSVETVSAEASLQVLHLKHLRATIPETSVRTAEISLEIRKGEWIAIFGATGTGKTTLLNSLFHPEYRLAGSLTWNGDLQLPHLPVPLCIYVTQKACLLTGTLRENFEGYPDEAIEDVLETVDLATWRTSLPDGLDSWLGENGETLSGGQRKKLLLAQALLKHPQLLVVDEPTAGISAENAIAVFRTVRHRYPAMAILMATHLKDIENAADRVIRI
jgi:ATP-binding cassette subfamily C protein CydC